MPNPEGMKDFARFSGLGMQLFLTIGLLALGGWWLDGKLGTSPIGLLLGVLLGFGAGLFSILDKVPGTTGRRRRPPPGGGDGPPLPPSPP